MKKRRRFHNTFVMTQEENGSLKKKVRERERVTYHVNIRQSYEQNDRSIITHWLIFFSVSLSLSLSHRFFFHINTTHRENSSFSPIRRENRRRFLLIG
jgi:hypothetical protein